MTRQIVDSSIVFLKRSKPVTTSLVVAEKFHKRHDNVLKTINTLDCPKEFTHLNFKVSSYVDSSGKKCLMYEITRDGFTLLAMGFTGKKAMQWKIKYINAFNKMETALTQQAIQQSNLAWQQARAEGKVVRRDETDTIKQFVEYATAQGSRNAHHYYSHITKMPYKALFLVECQYLHLRNILSRQQLSNLQTAEFMTQNVIKQGMQEGLHYRNIYQLAKDKITTFTSCLGRSYISQVANGKAVPKLPAAHRIARALGKRIEDVFIFED